MTLHEKYSDFMRSVLDSLSALSDPRIADDPEYFERLMDEFVMKIAGNSYAHQCFNDLREHYRNIANHRTDHYLDNMK